MQKKLLQLGVLTSSEKRVSCRFRRTLETKPSIARFSVDTNENGPTRFCPHTGSGIDGIYHRADLDHIRHFSSALRSRSHEPPHLVRESVRCTEEDIKTLPLEYSNGRNKTELLQGGRDSANVDVDPSWKKSREPARRLPAARQAARRSGNPRGAADLQVRSQARPA